MLQSPPPPAAAPSTSATPPPAPSVEVIITRPDPGLRRGRYEARPWVFWALIGVAVLLVLGYLARRLSWIPRKNSPRP